MQKARRPKINKTGRLTIRLEEELLAAAIAQADKEGRSVGDICRRAVAKYLKGAKDDGTK